MKLATDLTREMAGDVARRAEARGERVYVQGAGNRWAVVRLPKRSFFQRLFRCR